MAPGHRGHLRRGGAHCEDPVTRHKRQWLLTSRVAEVDVGVIDSASLGGPGA